jgi:hypothetical protein
MPDGHFEHLSHSAAKPDPLPAVLAAFSSGSALLPSWPSCAEGILDGLAPDAHGLWILPTPRHQFPSTWRKSESNASLERSASKGASHGMRCST